MQATEKHEFTWTSGHLSIKIGITFNPRWQLCDFLLDGVFDHLEIISLDPAQAKLPVGTNGYSSNLVRAGAIAANGGPVAATRKWLDEVALGAEWQDYLNTTR